MIWSVTNNNAPPEKTPLLPSSSSHLTGNYSNNRQHDGNLQQQQQYDAAANQQELQGTSSQQHEIKGTSKEEKKGAFSDRMYLFLTLAISTFFYIACVLTHPLRSSPSFKYNEINTIISFGDSYTTRYLDLDSLTYACRNCTSAGGPNWVIYLTDTTQWISWDFAYNSAPVNNSIVNQVPTVLDVSTQVRQFYQQIFVSPTEKIANIVSSIYNQRGIQHTHDSTLVTVWVGINDIDLTYNWNDTNALDLRIMQKYQILLDELIAKGEKNFMLINVPPLHKAPMWHQTEHEELIKARVLAYNAKLQAMTQQLRQAHGAAITVIEYNAYEYFDGLLENAADAGITDTLTYCPDWSHPVERHCKPIGEYFWLNDLHPTFHVHELLAKNIQQHLSRHV